MEIDYSNCESIQEVIVRETQAISITALSEHDELAQIYVSRGESYLIDGQYDKAIEDFQNADFHTEYCHDMGVAMIVAFRAAFGEVVCYDNLGMVDQTQQSLERLKVVATQVGCNNCIEELHSETMLTSLANVLHIEDFASQAVDREYSSRAMVSCKHKKEKGENNQSQEGPDHYNDILGPNQPPEPNWCEEIVTGVGRAMDAIACLAPNYAVKVALIAVIEALITRGVKCCQAGGFWKACVAPIARKWREWKNNKENYILPNAKNLPLFINLYRHHFLKHKFAFDFFLPTPLARVVSPSYAGLSRDVFAIPTSPHAAPLNLT